MDPLNMSQKEVDRYDIISQVLRKQLNGTEAANLLEVTTRHVRRLKKRVDKHGAKGLIHASRGKPSNRKMDKKKRSKIVDLLKTKYLDFKPTHASEKLKDVHKIQVGREAVRQIMITEVLWKPRNKRKKMTHRKWRRRRNHYGEMEQFDGSYHDWFETGEKVCLLAAIDDATGIPTRLEFAEHEGVFPVFGFWKEYLEDEGAPRAIYVDKFSTYSMNHKLAKENEDTLTQFERAFEELHIEVITAHSPQAKGRVERFFETAQDRLVKEMRLANIKTVKEANKYLKTVFIPWYAKKYGVEPESKTDVHRQLGKKELKRLDVIFSRQEERVVRNDFTVCFKGGWYQLTEQQQVTICKKDKVIIHEHLDGTVQMRFKGKQLNFERLPKRPKKLSEKRWVLPKRVERQPSKPSKNHPWRRSFIINEKSNQKSQVGHF